jgi:hypothetical protein
MLQRFAAVALVLFPGCASAEGHALTGAWGGSGVSLVVEAGSARLQADCAQGHIDGPIALDGAGRFSAKGAFEARHGGPQLVEEGAPAAPAARFDGRVRGDTMELTVTGPGDAAPVKYLLTRGARPTLVRCY